jgi:hypothetical protein
MGAARKGKYVRAEVITLDNNKSRKTVKKDWQLVGIFEIDGFGNKLLPLRCGADYSPVSGTTYLPKLSAPGNKLLADRTARSAGPAFGRLWEPHTSSEQAAGE